MLFLKPKSGQSFAWSCIVCGQNNIEMIALVDIFIHKTKNKMKCRKLPNTQWL